MQFEHSIETVPVAAKMDAILGVSSTRCCCYEINVEATASPTVLAVPKPPPIASDAVLAGCCCCSCNTSAIPFSIASFGSLLQYQQIIVRVITLLSSLSLSLWGAAVAGRLHRRRQKRQNRAFQTAKRRRMAEMAPKTNWNRRKWIAVALDASKSVARTRR